MMNGALAQQPFTVENIPRICMVLLGVEPSKHATS